MSEPNLIKSQLTVQSLTDLPIMGKRVVLRRSAKKDAQYLSECYNQVEFRRLFRLSYVQPVSAETMEKNLHDKNIPLNKLRKIEWIIYHRRKENIANHPIGLVSLADINQIHKTAEFQIGIANPDDRLAGLATEAAFLAMEFSFKALALFKLHSFVYGFNLHSQKSTVSLGFSQEGVLREQYWDPYEQKHIDLFVNGFLAREFWEHKRIAKLSTRLLGRDITQRNPQSALPATTLKTYSKAELSEMNALLKESFARHTSRTDQDL